MRRSWWLLVALVALMALLLKIGAALGQGEERFYTRGVAMVSGGWVYGSRPLGVLTPKGLQVTGYAFGPGRAEVAFCGRSGDRWALWKADVSGIGEARQARQQRIAELYDLDWMTLGRARVKEVSAEVHALESVPYDRSRTPPRRLWAAPEGVALRGPIWWAPDGTTVLLRAVRDGAADLVAVDDVTGRATWLTQGRTVVDVGWSATSRRLAYVTEERGVRTVWVRDAGASRALGPGGYDLRWSPDSNSLRWLAPSPDEAWVEMEWEAATGSVQQVGTKPARPEGARWSPDGRWCAAVTQGKLLLWPAASSRGETVPFADIVPQRVLGWSPDSNLLLLLGDSDHVLVVAVSPPASGTYIVDRTDVQARVLELAPVRVAWSSGFTLSPDADDPSWSSNGGLLAYAARSEAEPEGGPEVPLEGELFVVQFDRQYVEVVPELTPEVERIVVLQNVKHVALAMQMYLTDYDVSPPVDEQQRVMGILEEYVGNRNVFMRPGKPEEMVVQWKFHPGQPTSTIDDPTTEIAAIIDYSPEFYAVGYMDGHARLFEKAPP
jgi:Tol biopolymer transport system component